MVRKGGGSRVSSKRPTTTTVVGSTLSSIGQPALTYGGSGGTNTSGPSPHNNLIENGLGPGKNSTEAPPSAQILYGKRCPQCGGVSMDPKTRLVTDECGHAKCRTCMQAEDEGCWQCIGKPRRKLAVKTDSEIYTSRVHNDNVYSEQTLVNAAGLSSGSHLLTRRAAAHHRLQAATISRTNSINSCRQTSSSPSSSTSNDTGRHSASVYSDSADSDSCMRFPSTIPVENDGYPATIDFEAMAELTSPSIDPNYLSISDFNSTDNKSYTSIINEESEFSKNLMNIRNNIDPSIHNNSNSNSTTSTGTTTLGSTYHGGLVTRAQLKEMPTLAPVSSATPTSQSSPPPNLSRAAGSSGSSSASTSSMTRKRTRDSTNAESVADLINSKIASGGGSPDITEGVPRDIPQRSSRLSSPPIKLEEKSNSSSSSNGSRLNALLTRSSTRNYSKTDASSDTPIPVLPTSPIPSTSNTALALHSNSTEPTPSTSTGKRGRHSSESVSNEIKDEDKEYVDSLIGGDGSLTDEGGDDDDDDDSKPDAGDGSGDSVPKKKKKRSPVVIHDHITVLTGDTPMYQCNVCQKKFKTKAHIKYHEFCQKGDKPFKCEQCGQGFIAKSHYEYHLRTHTGERPYVCPKCGKGFNQRGKVTRHMRSHTGEKPFVCQECNRGFANAQALRSHTLIHTGERPFACTYCNKRFTGMTNLKKHVITHTGERPFSCNHCGKSFGLKWTLDLHLRTHSSERPYACDQCSRAFSNSKDLRRHLVIHSGERPFKCWICGTSFRRKDNLDRHIKNTHNQPKEVAKKLANEAAAEYLKKNTNNTIVNIPTSKVNSVVIGSPFYHWKKLQTRSSLFAASGIDNENAGGARNPHLHANIQQPSVITESNIIKNADLMPAGGIVPNNPNNKNKHAGTGSATTQYIKVLPKMEVKPSTSSSSSSAVSSSPATSTPSSVQTMPSPRRRVIITAPLSPPTTRASRSKETDSSKAGPSTALSHSSRSKTKITRQSSIKSKEVPEKTPSPSRRKETKTYSFKPSKKNHAKAGSPVLSKRREKTTPAPVVESEEEEVEEKVIVPEVEKREKRRKSKRKKAKKSKRRKQPKEKAERAPPPPSPPITDLVSTRSSETREVRRSKRKEVVVVEETKEEVRVQSEPKEEEDEEKPETMEEMLEPPETKDEVSEPPETMEGVSETLETNEEVSPDTKCAENETIEKDKSAASSLDFCNDLDIRRPTLTLVNPDAVSVPMAIGYDSPKHEQPESYADVDMQPISPSPLEFDSTSSNFLTSANEQNEDKVECILPHDIDQVDEADLMDTLSEEAANAASHDKLDEAEVMSMLANQAVDDVKQELEPEKDVILAENEETKVENEHIDEADPNVVDILRVDETYQSPAPENTYILPSNIDELEEIEREVKLLVKADKSPEPVLDEVASDTINKPSVSLLLYDADQQPESPARPTQQDSPSPELAEVTPEKGSDEDDGGASEHGEVSAIDVIPKDKSGALVGTSVETKSLIITNDEKSVKDNEPMAGSTLMKTETGSNEKSKVDSFEEGELICISDDECVLDEVEDTKVNVADECLTEQSSEPTLTGTSPPESEQPTSSPPLPDDVGTEGVDSPNPKVVITVTPNLDKEKHATTTGENESLNEHHLMDKDNTEVPQTIAGPTSSDKPKTVEFEEGELTDVSDDEHALEHHNDNDGNTHIVPTKQSDLSPTVVNGDIDSSIVDELEEIEREVKRLVNPPNEVLENSSKIQSSEIKQLTTSLATATSPKQSSDDHSETSCENGKQVPSPICSSQLLLVASPEPRLVSEVIPVLEKGVDAVDEEGLPKVSVQLSEQETQVENAKVITAVTGEEDVNDKQIPESALTLNEPTNNDKPSATEFEEGELAFVSEDEGVSDDDDGNLVMDTDSDHEEEAVEDSSTGVAVALKKPEQPVSSPSPPNGVELKAAALSLSEEVAQVTPAADSENENLKEKEHLLITADKCTSQVPVCNEKQTTVTVEEGELPHVSDDDCVSDDDDDDDGNLVIDFGSDHETCVASPELDHTTSSDDVKTEVTSPKTEAPSPKREDVPLTTEATSPKTETTPLTTEAMSPKTETTPLTTEATSPKTETTPLTTVATSSKPETTPLTTETTPLTTETTPLTTETTPLTTETTPLTTVATSPKKETTPLTTEATSSKTETTPLTTVATSPKPETTPLTTEATYLKTEATPLTTEAISPKAEVVMQNVNSENDILKEESRLEEKIAHDSDLAREDAESTNNEKSEFEEGELTDVSEDEHASVHFNKDDDDEGVLAAVESNRSPATENTCVVHSDNSNVDEMEEMEKEVKRMVTADTILDKVSDKSNEVQSSTITSATSPSMQANERDKTSTLEPEQKLVESTCDSVSATLPEFKVKSGDPSAEEKISECGELNELKIAPRPDHSMPPDLPDDVLSLLDSKTDEKENDLESISSGSLASPRSDVENSVRRCIRTLESDSEEENEVVENGPLLMVNQKPIREPMLTLVKTPALPISTSNHQVSSSSSVLVLPMSVPRIPSLTSSAPSLSSQTCVPAVTAVPTTLPTPVVSTLKFPILNLPNSSTIHSSVTQPTPVTTSPSFSSVLSPKMPTLGLVTSIPSPVEPSTTQTLLTTATTSLSPISTPKVPILNLPISSSSTVSLLQSQTRFDTSTTSSSTLGPAPKIPRLSLVNHSISSAQPSPIRTPLEIPITSSSLPVSTAKVVPILSGPAVSASPVQPLRAQTLAETSTTSLTPTAIPSKVPILNLPTSTPPSFQPAKVMLEPTPISSISPISVQKVPILSLPNCSLAPAQVTPTQTLITTTSTLSTSSVQVFSLSIPKVPIMAPQASSQHVPLSSTTTVASSIELSRPIPAPTPSLPNIPKEVTPDPPSDIANPKLGQLTESLNDTIKKLPVPEINHRYNCKGKSRKEKSGGRKIPLNSKLHRKASKKALSSSSSALQLHEKSYESVKTPKSVPSISVPLSSYVTGASAHTIPPRCNGMRSALVPLPKIPDFSYFSTSKSIQSPSATTSPVTVLPEDTHHQVAEISKKRPREPYLPNFEDAVAVPTRVQFMLPHSVPPVSTVADGTTSSVSIATTTQPTTAPVAYDPSLLYFVQQDGQQAFEGNYQLVYAAAAATAERDEGVVDGPPNKVRLLYAEALGVGPSDSQNGNELQFYYAATAPDQHVEHTSTPCHVQLMEPYRVSYSQTSNEANSELLQYQVVQPRKNEEQQFLKEDEQHVLNLSVNHNPVYYYNYNSTTTMSHQPPPPPQQLPQSSQQQQHSSYPEHGQYSSTSTARLVVAHQASYPGTENSSQLQSHRYNYIQYGNGEAQDLSARHLELPVHTERNDQIAYAHVRPNDPVQYNFLEKAREVQHVFPEGAFRHCDSNGIRYSSDMSNHNMSSEISPVYSKYGSVGNKNGGSGSSTSSIESYSNGRPKTALDLLADTTVKATAMQYETTATERAAAAIAAVGELARARRLETLDSQQLHFHHHRQISPQQPPPLRHLHPSMNAPSFSRVAPQFNKPEVTRPTAQQVFQNVMAQAELNPAACQQDIHQLYPPHPTGQNGNSSVGQELSMDINPDVRLGPRKYYLSRSAQFQD